jgi:hypothetical protein
MDFLPEFVSEFAAIIKLQSCFQTGFVKKKNPAAFIIESTLLCFPPTTTTSINMSTLNCRFQLDNFRNGEESFRIHTLHPACLGD